MAHLILYPAIDLLGGRCVTPRQGDAAGSPTLSPTFEDDPVAVASRWRDAGAEWLHVVDLDGALAGEPQHTSVVRAIADATGLPIQFTGGLRSEAAIGAALEAGAARVILGAAALQDPALLGQALERWGDRIAVSVDSRGGQVTLAGWLDIAHLPAVDFAVRMAGSGVRALVFTDLTHDGALASIEPAPLQALRPLLPETLLIAAGGIASLEDVRALARAGLDGVVLGRALYDGTLDLAEALRVVQETLATSDTDTPPTDTDKDADVTAAATPLAEASATVTADAQIIQSTQGDAGEGAAGS